MYREGPCHQHTIAIIFNVAFHWRRINSITRFNMKRVWFKELPLGRSPKFWKARWVIPLGRGWKKFGSRTFLTTKKKCSCKPFQAAHSSWANPTFVEIAKQMSRWSRTYSKKKEMKYKQARIHRGSIKAKGKVKWRKEHKQKECWHLKVVILLSSF